MINPLKTQPVAFKIQKENGNSESFMDFLEELIINGWLVHYDMLVMGNARIHTGGEASIMEEFLWEAEVRGRALNILVIFLPTWSPELNSIELVFHFLTQ